MFFACIDHYGCDYYDEIIEKPKLEGQECVICLDNGNTISLDCVHGYIKLCNCNVNVHGRCLEEWYKKNMTCIICKSDIVSVKSVDIRLSLEKRKRYIQTIKFFTMASTILNLLLIYELYTCIVLHHMLFIF